MVRFRLCCSCVLRVLSVCCLASLSHTDAVIDCTWLDWSQWSACTLTCGSGTRTRSRDKNPASGGGADCPGMSTQSEACNTQACPVNCVWGPWSSFTTCSVPCGGGSQTRTREEEVSAANGGTACVGPATETQTCNTQLCPVNCEWDQWSQWTTCTVDCGGGTQTRSRAVGVQAANGGTACTGAADESRTCGTTACPVDCDVSLWTAWSACSLVCGGGTALSLSPLPRPSDSMRYSNAFSHHRDAACEWRSCLSD